MEKVKVTFLRHHELAKRASETAEAGQNEKLTVLSYEIKDAFAMAEEAMDAYRNHVREHGCAREEAARAAAVGGSQN